MQYFTTLASDTSTKWSLAVKGPTAAGVTKQDVSNKFAAAYGVNPMRMVNLTSAPKAPTTTTGTTAGTTTGTTAGTTTGTTAGTTTGGGRRLTTDYTDTFTGILAVDRSSTMNTKDIATLTATREADLKTDLLKLFPTGYSIDKIESATYAPA